MKKHRFRRDRRGFSLVELLIAVAILAVLGAAVIGFITTGSNSFRSIYGLVSLETKAQMTVNQLQEYLIDCNGGVYFGDNTLYVLDVNEGGGFTEHIFALSGKALEYSAKSFTGSGDYASAAAEDGGPLTDRASAFSVAVPAQPAGSADASWAVNSVTVTVTLATTDRTRTQTEVVALRNSPLTAGSEADMVAAVLAANP